MSIEEYVSMFIEMMMAVSIFTAGYVVYQGRFYGRMSKACGGAGRMAVAVVQMIAKAASREEVRKAGTAGTASAEKVSGRDKPKSARNEKTAARTTTASITPKDGGFNAPSLPLLPASPQRADTETSGKTGQERQKSEKDTMTAIGYIDSPKGDRPFVIPEKDRQNIGIFGEIGSGKTTVLRLLIMQDIIRKTGFLLIDPHREFGREVLSMIPPDMQHKVVYVSLASLYQFGRTVCINPLQTQTDHEKYIRTAGCIDNLKQYFSDGWGHRLETVLRNMINLVMSTPDTFKFLDIIKILFDESKRSQALQKCTNPAVRDFWINVFPKFAPEASGAIYNKFDKIINTPPIAAIFSSAVSTISIREIIEDGKIVIVDLGSAATVDIIEFVGTLLINMFNLENKIRFDLGDARKIPFNIYIDEVHMFSAPVIRELLNNVRKYNMKVTVATQSIKVLDEDLAKELDDLFRCMVMFRCDAETGRLLARNLPLDERQLAQLSFHRFAAFSQGFQRVSGIGKTKHAEIPSRWRQVAQESLERYGKEISTLSEDSFGMKKTSHVAPKLSPLEYFIINMLYLQEGAMVRHKEIVAAATARFGVDERAVNTALLDSLLQHYRYVARSIDYRRGAKQFDTDAAFLITKLGVQSIYSRAFAGSGAGGQLHTGVISAIADAQIAQYHYCIPDLADTVGRRADLVIYEFRPLKNAKTARARADPNIWSNTAIAVEVETDPTKHKEQVVMNYEKNALLGMQVWFVVFSQRHKEYVREVMAQNSITMYEIAVVDPGSIDAKNSQILPLLDAAGGAADATETAAIKDRAATIEEDAVAATTTAAAAAIEDRAATIKGDAAAATTTTTVATAAAAAEDRAATIKGDAVAVATADDSVAVARKTANNTDKPKRRKTSKVAAKSKKNTYLRASQVFAVLESIEIRDEKVYGVMASKKQEQEELDRLSEYEGQTIEEEREEGEEENIQDDDGVQDACATDKAPPNGMTKYKNINNHALEALINDDGFADMEPVRKVLKSRGYAIRRKRNQDGLALYRIRQDANYP